jgi:hypothetical protein
MQDRSRRDDRVQKVSGPRIERSQGDRPDEVLAADSRREDQDHEKKEKARPAEFDVSKDEDGETRRQDEHGHRDPVGYARNKEERVRTIETAQPGVLQDMGTNTLERGEVREEGKRKHKVRNRGRPKSRAATLAAAREKKRMERRDVLDQE